MNEWAQALVQGLREAPPNFPGRAHPQIPRWGNESPDRQRSQVRAAHQDDSPDPCGQDSDSDCRRRGPGLHAKRLDKRLSPDQERGGKWGAEAKQGHHLGLCEFRDSLFSDWPGIQAQSCCSGSRKETGGAGTPRVSYNQGSENFSWRGSKIPLVPGSETGGGGGG